MKHLILFALLFTINETQALALSFNELKEGQRVRISQDLENVLFKCQDGLSGKGILMQGSEGTIVLLNASKRLSLKSNLISSIMSGNNYRVSIQLDSNPTCAITLSRREFLNKYNKNPDFSEIELIP